MSTDKSSAESIDHRSSYSIKVKLQLLKQLAISGASVRSFAALHKIDESTVRRWKRDEAKMKLVVKGAQSSRTMRKLPGSGRKSAFPALEARLFSWIQSRNKAGLRVKDKYIVAKAKAFREQMIAEDDQAPQQIKLLQSFAASSSWCYRFKKRYALVSRRVTSCRSLPEGFQQTAVEFIEQVQSTIDRHGIKAKNVINLDQVPRYFETENNSTITEKGTREVKVKKASSSHKRFTMTPVINAAGEFLALHLLFSGLKNKPNIDENCICDVNKTGMWSTQILQGLIDGVIVKKCQTCFLEPVLIILDSYGTHTKFVKDHGDSYARRNVLFAVIPPCLTGLLQPLDVCLNRGFQQMYNDKYTEYLTKAVFENSFRTKSGSISMPKYRQVSEWVHEWSNGTTKEAVSKAFLVCGLVSKKEFDVEKMHRPLADCYLDMDPVFWEAEHAAVITSNPDPIETDLWHIYEGSFSFARAVHKGLKEIEDFEDWIEGFNAKIIKFIETDDELGDLFDAAEQAIFIRGELTDSKVELLAVAKAMDICISLTEFDGVFNTMEEVVYCSENVTKLIMFVQIQQGTVGVLKDA